MTIPANNKRIKTLEDFLGLFPKVKKLSGNNFQVPCPAHEDKEPSLSVTESDKKILLKCHAGCKTEDILAKLHLSINDLFLNGSKPKSEAPKLIATYDYKDIDGKLLYQRCRYQPKTFRERQPQGNDWTWNMHGAKRVIYHLPDLNDNPDSPIYWVEGEKDADNLWNYGQVSTTSGGANSWQPQFAEYLKNRKVIIIPDKDTSGFAHARQVAKDLRGKAKELKAIILPYDNVKDVSDWLEEDGDIEKLKNMEQDISVLFRAEQIPYVKQDEAIIWDKVIGGTHLISFNAQDVRREHTGIHARISIAFDEGHATYTTFNIGRSDERTKLTKQASKYIPKGIEYTLDLLNEDIDKFCDGLWNYDLSHMVAESITGLEVIPPIEYVLKPFVVEAGGTVLFAPPGRGKSYTGLLWAQSVNYGICKFWQVKRSVVLFVNLERSMMSVRRRLTMINRVLGLSYDSPLLMVNQRGRTLNDVAPIIKQAIRDKGVNVIVLDSISRAGYGDLTDNKAMNDIVDQLNALCSTWVALAHTPRTNEEHAFGSVMLDAGADVQVMLSTEISSNGTLGIGLESTKTNDTPHMPQQVLALEFDEVGLTNVREADPDEFPQIKEKSHEKLSDKIVDYIKDLPQGKATANQIAQVLNLNRSTVAQELLKEESFVKLNYIKGKAEDGGGQYYGVKF